MDLNLTTIKFQIKIQMESLMYQVNKNKILKNKIINSEYSEKLN